jgi:hypothetical protein
MDPNPAPAIAQVRQVLAEAGWIVEDIVMPPQRRMLWIRLAEPDGPLVVEIPAVDLYFQPQHAPALRHLFMLKLEESRRLVQRILAEREACRRVVETHRLMVEGAQGDEAVLNALACVAADLRARPWPTTP